MIYPKPTNKHQLPKPKAQQGADASAATRRHPNPQNTTHSLPHDEQVSALSGAGNNGLLTFPANLHGNPAISIPAGFIDGLPVGLQIIGRHFSEQLLLDAAHRLEQLRPWPLVA